MTDEQPLTGAQFKREVGADPELWARRFLKAYASVDPGELRTEEDRLAFVAAWFHDAMQAAVKAAMP